MQLFKPGSSKCLQLVQDKICAVNTSFKTLRSSLSICILCISDLLAQALSPHLGEVFSAEYATAHHPYTQFRSAKDLLQHVRQAGHVDCLILEADPELQGLFDQLQQQAIFFPTVIIEPPSLNSDSMVESFDRSKYSYHSAVIQLPWSQINQIKLAIDQAISKFLQLQPDKHLAANPATATETSLTHKLMAQQLRLAEKLKERLDYLGVYYKRNPENFLRRMTPPQREELLRQLRLEYREIVLAYFSEEPYLNEKIDNFVNVVFFADVPISQIVEIHMDLMDEFSKQLKLEGRSDEMLLDYRLTLIDTLAHLCEMYRRSIPRES